MLLSICSINVLLLYNAKSLWSILIPSYEETVSDEVGPADLGAGPRDFGKS